MPFSFFKQKTPFAYVIMSNIHEYLHPANQNDSLWVIDVTINNLLIWLLLTYDVSLQMSIVLITLF